MRSPRFFCAMGCVVSLLLAHIAVASVVPPSLLGASAAAGPAAQNSPRKYIYFPRSCQSLLIVAKVDNVPWALYYDAEHENFYPKQIDLTADVSSSFVWILIDYFDHAGNVLATIRPYDNQVLALTAENEMLRLQRAAEDAHNQAWSVLLAPSDTFFKRNANIFVLNHHYMSFANSGNGGSVVRMKASWIERAVAVSALDPITGQSCATSLNERYNHLLY